MATLVTGGVTNFRGSNPLVGNTNATNVNAASAVANTAGGTTGPRRSMISHPSASNTTSTSATSPYLSARPVVSNAADTYSTAAPNAGTNNAVFRLVTDNTVTVDTPMISNRPGTRSSGVAGAGRAAVRSLGTVSSNTHVGSRSGDAPRAAKKPPDIASTMTASAARP